MQSFHVCGLSHVTVLFLTVLATLVMVSLCRRGQEGMLRPLERLLAAVLLLEWPCNLLISWETGNLDVNHLLPAHLCDVAALLGGWALLTKRQEPSELVYFWGLAGTAQGLLTPALGEDYPNIRFFAFFALHAGVVITALHLVIGRRITPRAGAVARAMKWLVVYAALVGLINAALGSNYGFLCDKPPNASLLDALGPWPWYIGSLGLVAWAFFTLLDLPFRRGRSR